MNFREIPRQAKTGLFFTFSQALVAGTNLLVVLILSPILGPDGFGEISLIWMITLFASIFVDSRLNTGYSIKFFKLTATERVDHVSLIYFYYLLSSTILLLIPINDLVGHFFNIEISRYGWYKIIILVFLHVTGAFYTNHLVLTSKGLEYFLIKVLWSVIFLSAALFYSRQSILDPYDYIESWLFSYGFVALIGIFRLKVGLPRFKFRTNYLKTYRSLFLISVPLVFEGLATMLLASSDRYFVQNFAGIALFGIYAFAYRFSESVNSLLLNPIGQVLAPALMKVFHTDNLQFQRYYERVLSLYLLFAFSIGLIFQFLFKILFYYVIDVDFALSSKIVDLLVLGALVLGFGNLLAFKFLVLEKTKELLRLNIIVLIFSIITGYFFTSWFTIYGASISMIFTYLFFTFFLYRDKLNSFKISTLFRGNIGLTLLFSLVYVFFYIINFLEFYSFLVFIMHFFIVATLLLFFYRKIRNVLYSV
jgi:O-antigen/teichoic acid export membrane protein